MSEHQKELLGAYVLGVLDDGERDTVQQHLDDCELCRVELDELREIEAALGQFPPEALVDGPPEDADLLLQRTLRQVRSERSRSEWQRRAVWTAAAAAVGVVAIGGGALIGRSTATSEPVGQAGSSAAVTAVPGTRVASASDSGTGATMTVTLQPAAGWVRVHATVSGVAAGEQCRLIVVGRNGSRREAGSWLVSEAAARNGGTVDGSALVAPDDVASVQVETFGGRPLVSVPI